MRNQVILSCPEGGFRRYSQRPTVEAEPAIEEILGETIEALQVRHHDFLDAEPRSATEASAAGRRRASMICG